MVDYPGPGPTDFAKAPTDQNQTKIAAAKGGFNQWIDTNGNWQAVVLEQECKRLSISCFDGNPTYDHLDRIQEFHWTYNEDGSEFKISNSINVSVALKKGDIAGYVRAPAGLKISIVGTL